MTGSSQGLNSPGPMRLTVESVRRRSSGVRLIRLHHVDQPSNDFNSLFELLDTSPDRYSLNDPYVFPCAVGRSFYENVLPANSVHVGWSSYAAMWVRRIPALIPGHFAFQRSTGEVRAAWERQGAEDWETFLSLERASCGRAAAWSFRSPALTRTARRRSSAFSTTRTRNSKQWSTRG